MEKRTLNKSLTGGGGDRSPLSSCRIDCALLRGAEATTDAAAAAAAVFSLSRLTAELLLVNPRITLIPDIRVNEVPLITVIVSFMCID